jgi:hypothetical protein
MEEAPEKGKESPHSIHANGMNEISCSLNKWENHYELSNKYSDTRNLIQCFQDPFNLLPIATTRRTDTVRPSVVMCRTEPRHMKVDWTAEPWQT